ncbi:hypothetical protein Pth03_77900 [Planotetraspora thailandica]|uniref:Uncharacterized protein n=1 Tax=Planotetraspora thailandica TaxID=487172 RepID=A0A8J4DFD3_9ACTN|nr:hypothetical protein [Planotetraspora thailandica]GII59401.1 hypothetical protein Pth03_77900 [Planotetraspora thailandica]
MDDLAKLAASVTEFASASSMTLVPAVPEGGCGGEVFLGPGKVDLPGFLAMAHKLGGNALYMEAAPFDPADVEDPSADLAERKGQVGQIEVAFAANGIVHFWQQRAAWYAEWQQGALDQTLSRVHLDKETGLTDEDRERPDDKERAQLYDEERELIGKQVEMLLANSDFRAARGSARRRASWLALSGDSSEKPSWTAIDTACEQAEEMARVRYAELARRFDELAAELLADPEYQQTRAASARKQVVERFLIARADGFSAPVYVRDELHARAQQLGKSSGTKGGLF